MGIWDAASGQRLARIQERGERVLWAAFDSGGTMVVTCADDRTARVWPVDVLAVARRRLPRELTREELARLELAR
ncbi:MAG: hypothetical protein HY721_12030 [Planctomycetes bacterium]|nr:hypothetical protein [Planctomycetota bacterium]